MKPIAIDSDRVEVGSYLGLVLRVLPVLVLVGLGCSLAGAGLIAAAGLMAAALPLALLFGAGIGGLVLVLLVNALLMDWQLLSLKVDESTKDSQARRRLMGKVEMGTSPSIVSFNSVVTSPSIAVDGRKLEINGLPAELVGKVLDLAEARGNLARRGLVGEKIGEWTLTTSDYNKVIDALRDKKQLVKGQGNTYMLLSNARDARQALGLPLSGERVKVIPSNQTTPHQTT